MTSCLSQYNRGSFSFLSANCVFIFLEHGLLHKNLTPEVTGCLGWNVLSIKIPKQAAALCPCMRDRCSQNFQYQMDCLIALNLIHSYSFDWNSHILAASCVFLVRTEELREHNAFYQCPLARGLHAKNISNSLFGHTGFVVWICQNSLNQTNHFSYNMLLRHLQVLLSSLISGKWIWLHARLLSPDLSPSSLFLSIRSQTWTRATTLHHAYRLHFCQSCFCYVSSIWFWKQSFWIFFMVSIIVNPNLINQLVI